MLPVVRVFRDALPRNPRSRAPVSERPCLGRWPSPPRPYAARLALLAVWVGAGSLPAEATALPDFARPVRFAPVLEVPVPRPVDVKLPLRRRPRRAEDVEVVTSGLDADGPVALLAPPRLDRRGRALTYRVGLQDLKTGRLRMTVELRRGRRVLRRFRIRHRITPAPEWPSEAELERWGKSLQAVRSKLSALETRRAQPEGYRAPGAQPVDLKPIEETLEQERRQIRLALALTAQHADDPALARAATRTAWKAQSASPGPFVPPISDPLEEAVDALLRLRLDTAEAALTEASSSAASPAELARIRELQSGLARMQGRSAAAVQRAIQALTLQPDLSSAHPLPWVATVWRAERERLAPARPLRVGRITLLPATQDGVDGLNVRVEFGPDPGRLVRGARMQIEQSSRMESLEVNHEADSGLAQGFAARPSDDARQVPVTVELTTEDGQVVAAVGRPQPIYVPLARPERRGPKIPRWVWWVAGGAAVAGAAVATGVAISENSTPQPDRALGPFEFRF